MLKLAPTRGRLRSLGLVEYPQPGHVAARSTLVVL